MIFAMTSLRWWWTYTLNRLSLFGYVHGWLKVEFRLWIGIYSKSQSKSIRKLRWIFHIILNRYRNPLRNLNNTKISILSDSQVKQRSRHLALFPVRNFDQRCLKAVLISWTLCGIDGNIKVLKIVGQEPIIGILSAIKRSLTWDWGIYKHNIDDHSYWENETIFDDILRLNHMGAYVLDPPH